MTAKYAPLIESRSDCAKHSIFEYKSAFQYKDTKLKFNSIYTYKPNSNDLRTNYLSENHEGFASKVFAAVLVFLSYLIVILTAPISVWLCIKIIPEHERLLVFRLGRVHSIRGPGFTFLLPCIERWVNTDVRIRAFNVPPQQLITSDGAIVELGAIIQFRIINVLHSVLHVRNLNEAYRILSRSLFLNCLCKKTLLQLQQERVFICQELSENFNLVTMDWGIKVENVDIPHVKVLKQSEPIWLLKSFLSSEKVSSGTLATQKESTDSSENEVSSTLHYTLNEFVNFISGSGIFNAEDATFKLEVVSSKFETFYIAFKNGQGTILQNVDMPIDVSIRIAEADLVRIIRHDLTPLQAYIGGHMQIEGNIQLLMKFEAAMQTMRDDVRKHRVFTV